MIDSGLDLDLDDKQRSSIFLKSLYDQMIIWNASGASTKLSMWKHLGLSAKDYIAFNENPEKWAISYLKNGGGFQ